MDHWADFGFVTAIEVGARIPLKGRSGDNIEKCLIESTPRWPNKRVDLLGFLDADDSAIFHHLTITKPDDERDPGMDLDLEFDQQFKASVLPRRRRRGGRGLESIQSILKTISSNVGESHFHCRVSWKIPDGQYETIVSLPLMNFNQPDFPFDQISGIRFTSLEVRRSVILDRTWDDSLAATAAFEFYGTLGETTFKDTVEEGLKFLKVVVTEASREDNDVG